ncbi:uncharacterized protein TrAtP1_013356 [Trichoderma atroviride]|uniref:uncharacterized protein n=1 Tax=Hypocrea atroviridis TaxID=63577 RepID=UPI003322D740|nr:hypothetical protein TrAtP1_013356 [Trichoderma atroviride]
MTDDDYQPCMDVMYGWRDAQPSEHVRRQIPSHAVMHRGGCSDDALFSLSLSLSPFFAVVRLCHSPMEQHGPAFLIRSLGTAGSSGRDPCHDVTHARTQPLGMNHDRKGLILLQLVLFITYTHSYEQMKKRKIQWRRSKGKSKIYRRLLHPLCTHAGH